MINRLQSKHNMRKLVSIFLIITIIMWGMTFPANAETITEDSGIRTFVYNDGTLLVNVPIESQIEMANLHGGVLYMYGEVTAEEEPEFGSGLVLSPMEGNMPAEEQSGSEETPDDILPGDGTTDEAGDTSGEGNSGDPEGDGTNSGDETSGDGTGTEDPSTPSDNPSSENSENEEGKEGGNNDEDISGGTSGESSGTESETIEGTEADVDQGVEPGTSQGESSSEKTDTETSGGQSSQPDSSDAGKTPADNTGSDDAQSQEDTTQTSANAGAEVLQPEETENEIIEADVPDETIAAPEEEISVYEESADAQAENTLVIGEEQAEQNQTIAVVANISPASDLDFSVSESLMMSSIGTTTALTIPDLVITNNSETIPLKVTSISISGASGWSLVAADTDFEALDVDCRQMGFTIAGSHDFSTGPYDECGNVYAGKSRSLSISGNAAPVSQDMTTHLANMVVTVTGISEIQFTLYDRDTATQETHTALEGMTWGEWIESDYSGGTFTTTTPNEDTYILYDKRFNIYHTYPTKDNNYTTIYALIQDVIIEGHQYIYDSDAV